MQLLVIKLSSLGDVIHALPALTDAKRCHPELYVDWVVEEAYQAIPGWHPAVRRVIPVALRRWRKSLWRMIKRNEWFQFRSHLKADRYNLVLDAQGLMKSAWIGWQAHGPAAGRNTGSARESLAAAFYNRRYEIDLTLPEVEQVRQLFALALGYSQPASPADFGIDRTRVPASTISGRYAVLAHGAAWESKLWPVESWISVGKQLGRRHLLPVLPWGTEQERLRAERIASQCSGHVLPKSDLSQLAGVLGGADLVVGLDTGLTHIAIALGRPTVTLYGPSIPVYREIRGGNVVHLTSSTAQEVDTHRKNTVPLRAVLDATERLLNAPKAPA